MNDMNLADLFSGQVAVEVTQVDFYGKEVKTLVAVGGVKMEDNKIVIIPKQDLFKRERDDGR